MNKYTQFAKENWWRIIIAIIFLSVVIASVYFKWKTVIFLIWWTCLAANFFFLLYKRHLRLKSKS
jgi:hypothetical protein